MKYLYRIKVIPSDYIVWLFIMKTIEFAEVAVVIKTGSLDNVI